MKFVVLLVSTCLLASAMSAPHESAPGNLTEKGHHDPHVNAAGTPVDAAAHPVNAPVPHVGTEAPHVNPQAPHVGTEAPHVGTEAPHVNPQAPHVGTEAPHVNAPAIPVNAAIPPVAVRQPSVPVQQPRVVTPVFSEAELMKEMSQRMQGLIEVIQWHKLGFSIDENRLEEALHSTNKFACTSPAQTTNMLKVMNDCKLEVKAMMENKNHLVDKIHRHMMTGNCFFKKIVGFSNVTGAVNQNRIIREIENTTLSAEKKAAAKSDFVTCLNNKKMPVPHLLVKMQMANQKKMDAMVTEWMTSMMNNNAETSSKAAEIHKHMKEHLVVKKAMICQVAALMANGCAKDELDMEQLV